MNQIKKVVLLIFLLLVFLTPTFVYADTDKTSLISVRDEVNLAINNQLQYETNSYNAFFNSLTALGGLVAVDAMIDDVAAIQDDIDLMTLNLETILSGLTLDTTFTQITLQYFQEKSRDTSLYTTRSILIYDAELDRIKTILNEPTSGEELITSLSNDIINSSGLLVLLGDKTNLISIYNTAESVYADGSIYLPVTYNAFKTSYDLIDASLLTEIGFTKLEVINNVDASENEVNQTISKIQSSIDLLVEKPDKTAFLDYYNQTLNDLVEEEYTPDSYTIFQTEVSSILSSVNDVNTTAEELSQLQSDFEDVISALVLRADKVELEVLNNQVIIAYYEEKADYTDSSYQLFKQAVLDYGSYLYINQKLADLNISQDEIDVLTAKLVDALSLLEKKQDNTELLEEYNIVSTKIYMNYTPNSIVLFEAELDRIYENITGDELSIDLYNQTVIDLENADQLLVERADLSQLSDLYLSTSNYNAEDYSNSSYLTFVRVKTDTVTILMDENVSQDVVDQQTIALTNAINDLHKPIDEIVIHVFDSFNVLSFITLGDSSVQSIVSTNEDVFTVDSDGNVIGNHFGKANVVVILDNGISETISVLVKANISTLTIILTATIPVVTLGSAAGLLFLKKSHFQVFKKLIFWKRKKS